ncbi:MAG: hypothetical protein Q7S57_01185 [bacterium]|nr:hypothetical protein [bacterium]
MYKDATVYTGTVVEACLLYVLTKYLTLNKVSKSKVLTPIWKEEASGIIYDFSKRRRIRHIREKLSNESLKDSVNFIEINRACKRLKILSKKEFELAEEIRTARNKIHVSGLKEIDNSYSKEQLDAIFNKANKIIRKVEKKIRKTKKRHFHIALSLHTYRLIGGARRAVAGLASVVRLRSAVSDKMGSSRFKKTLQDVTFRFLTAFFVGNARRRVLTHSTPLRVYPEQSSRGKQPRLPTRTARPNLNGTQIVYNFSI